jgi:hypothetical protein
MTPLDPGLPMRETDLVFCANSGRVGSRYLAALVDSSEEAIARHEPEPKMIGEYLTLVNNEDYAFSYALRRTKSEAIRLMLRDAPRSAKVYCETTHMFIKTFYDVVLDEFPRSKVVILRRSLAQTLKSFVELGYFTPANQNWPKWMSSPNAKTAALPATGPDSGLDGVDLAIAYLLDIEARIQRMRQQYPNVATLDMRLEDLTNPTAVDRLFDWLGLTPSKTTADMLSQKINAKDEIKRKLGSAVSLDWCQQRIDAYVAGARRAWPRGLLRERLDAALAALREGHS